MHKNTLLKFNLVALFVLSIVLFACRKDISQVLNSSDKPEIDWAKDYFNQVLLKNEGNQVSYRMSSKTSAVRKIIDIPNMKTPLWVRATDGKNKWFNFVEVPLIYSQKLTRSVSRNGEPTDPKVLKASFDRLVIYKDKNGFIHERIISYIPDKEYCERHKGDISHNRINKLDKDFSGFLTYREWNGEIAFRLRVNNGVARKLKATKISVEGSALSKIATDNSKRLGKVSVNKDNQKSSTVEICWDIIEYLWHQECFYDNPDDPYPRFCTDPVLISETVIGNVCEEMYYYDPSDCSDPSNFGTGDCTEPGGGPGCTSCNPEPEPKEDPCKAKARIDALRNNARLDSIQNVIRSKTDGYEWGANISYKSLSTNSAFVPEAVITDYSSDELELDFTWNSTDGYSVGFDHLHTGQTAPSHEDVFRLLDRYNILKNLTSDTSQLNFYKRNAVVSVTTASGSYALTVRDWTKLQYIYDAYMNDEAGKDAMLSGIRNTWSAAYTEVQISESILLLMMQDSITLIKEDPNTSSKITKITFDEDGNPTILNIPCND